MHVSIHSQHSSNVTAASAALVAMITFLLRSNESAGDTAPYLVASFVSAYFLYPAVVARDFNSSLRGMFGSRILSFGSTLARINSISDDPEWTSSSIRTVSSVFHWEDFSRPCWNPTTLLFSWIPHVFSVPAPWVVALLTWVQQTRPNLFGRARAASAGKIVVFPDPVGAFNQQTALIS